MAQRASAIERPVFTVGGETYSWLDVIAVARARGAWMELEEATRRGLACVRRLAASGEELDDQALEEAATAFRYERSLLAADELTEWLARWQLSLPAWRDHLRRALLRERFARELDEIEERYLVPDEETEGTLWAEAVCSGFLEDTARQLAGTAALAAEAGEALEGGGDAFRRLEAAAARARAAAVTAKAVEREVELHGFDWLRVEGSLLELPTEDAAREAALCVRVDRRPLLEVARACSAAPRQVGLYLGEVDGELASLLFAGREGELVGPVTLNGSFALVLVEAKVRPSAADPDVRRKAEGLIVARTVERAVAARVRWHELL